MLDPEDPGRTVAETRRATPRSADAIVDALAAAVGDLDATVGGDGVAAVGLGAAGLVDASGVLRFAPNLSGTAEFPLRDRLAQRLGRPVAIDNDATAATLAEHRLGAGVGSRDLVMVTLGTGIGGGHVSGGQLVRGAHGFAGEAGHMLVDPTGPPCPCGRRGCWERYASGSGLARLGREAAEAGQADRLVELAGGEVDAVRGEHVGAGVAEGDPGALAVLDRFAWWVAVGVANLVNVLDCDTVIIGGGLVEMGERLLAPVRSAYDGLVFAAEHRPPVRIVGAQLGAEAGAIGGWLLASDLVAGR